MMGITMTTTTKTPRAARAPKPLTAADYEKAMAHDARAALRGDEECACKLCTRVAAELAAKTA